MPYKEFDARYKDHLKRKIKELKHKVGALIVAHNYQRDEIQEVADITGDSFALAREVTRAKEKVVVFCGVKFMAESAYILSPDKTILLPVEEAGCPLADMVTVEKLKKKKEEYPEAAVVCYVNSTAAVKAESDICCTSSNAIEVVRSLREDKVIFVPDKNLGRYVREHVPEKELILWDGYCVVHMRLTAEDVVRTKNMYPDAEFIAHPECRKEVLNLAEYIGSTAAMIKHVRESDRKEFIVGTETGIDYRLQRDNPEKKFYMPTDQFICANMKLTTLGWLARSLEKMVYKIEVPENVARRARKSLERMLEVV
ncbi:MAG: quinolinate synthase NadA [Candidatus Omnitrophica bacterium]|nr:quinolinate synthase NadA [Candidatus Omnitrophota bacterium]MDD5488099.1 quinolinate synthase NadA [Candidatus Omnitrophota bacterium]